MKMKTKHTKTVRAVLKEKFIAVNAYIKKKKDLKPTTQPFPLIN